MIAPAFIADAEPQQVMVSCGCRVAGSLWNRISLMTGATIVKGTVALLPPAVLTDKVRGPSVAAASMSREAVRDADEPTETEVTVTPVPLTVTVVAPDTKLLPDM